MEELTLLIPPFILKEAPKPPEEEKVLATTPYDDPTGGNVMNSVVPNFKKKVANLHYISQMTGEYGTIFIRPGMTEDEIMEQYATLFPKECRVYLEEIKLMNQTLHHSSGMSKERQMMAITKIPEIMYTAMKFIDQDYWFDKNRFYKFVRKYPKFMVGEHKRKLR